jgi:hypothetical protein
MSWPVDLFFSLSEGKPWDEQLTEEVQDSTWTDFAHARGLNLDRTLHSLCKSNGGRFKSHAQAALIIEKLAPQYLEAHERVDCPEQWVENADSPAYMDYMSVQTVFGKDDRYSAYGFILDESGVVAKIKFQVETRLTESATLGRVDSSSGEVVYRREDNGADA